MFPLARAEHKMLSHDVANSFLLALGQDVMRRSISILVLLLVTDSLATAQDAGAKLLVLDFNDSALIEIDERDQDSVTIVSSRMKYRTQMQEVRIAKSRQEVRTRTVQVNGTPTEQSFTVQVPYIEIVNQASTIGAPGEPRFTSVPIEEVSAWDADGNTLNRDQLRTRLSKPAAAIILKTEWPDGGTIEPTQLAVLRDDIFFVYAAILNQANNQQQIGREGALRRRIDEPNVGPETSKGVLGDGR